MTTKRDRDFDSASDISRQDFKIRASGDRLMRADMRRGANETNDLTDSLLLPEDFSKHGPHRWLIELDGLPGAYGPLRIQVAGDVTIGIWRGTGAAPDLDLGLYCTDDKGVSRHHALLRPGQSRLYLIDLESKNGTRVNQMPLSSTIVKDVQDQDIVSLGVLSFVLRILATPADF